MARGPLAMEYRLCVEGQAFPTENSSNRIFKIGLLLLLQIKEIVTANYLANNHVTDEKMNVILLICVFLVKSF